MVVALVLGLVASSTTYAAETAEKKKPSRPEVYKVRPSSGSIDGGTVIMLRGKFFTGTKRVMMDKTPVTEWQVLSDKQLRIVAPPHAIGLYRIWVTTKQGRAKPGAFDGFRYIDDTVPPPPPPLNPTVTKLTPKQGTFFGGTTVTITGTNFTAGTLVTFGDSAASSIVVNSATSITVTSPPHSLGTVDVRVTTAIGTSANVPEDDFTYNLFG